MHAEALFRTLEQVFREIDSFDTEFGNSFDQFCPVLVHGLLIGDPIFRRQTVFAVFRVEIMDVRDFHDAFAGRANEVHPIVGFCPVERERFVGEHEIFAAVASDLPFFLVRVRDLSPVTFIRFKPGVCPCRHGIEDLVFGQVRGFDFFLEHHFTVHHGNGAGHVFAVNFFLRESERG